MDSISAYIIWIGITAFAYDLNGINNTLDQAVIFCGGVNCEIITNFPNTLGILQTLQSGGNDGNPGINDLDELLLLTLISGQGAISVQDAADALNTINEDFGLALDDICYASTAPVCYQVTDDCPNTQSVPTLSEWGLILLSILLMTYGTLVIGSGSTFLTTSENIQLPMSNTSLPFNKQEFYFAFILTTVLGLIGFTCSISLYGGVFMSDIIGVIFTAPVFAYFVHLLLIAQKEQ